MKTSLKGARNFQNNDPIAIKTRGSTKSNPKSSPNHKSSIHTAMSQQMSLVFPLKNPSSSRKANQRTAPRDQPLPTQRATRNSSQSNKPKSVPKSRSPSPKKKAPAQPNKKQSPQKPNNQKPNLKSQRAQSPKKKRSPSGKSSPRRVQSPKKSQTPKRIIQKEQPQKVANTRNLRSQEVAKENRSPAKQNRSGDSSMSPSAKRKADYSDHKDQGRANRAKMSPKKTKQQETSKELETEDLEPIDLSVPDPVSEFIRDPQGRLVKSLTESEKDLTLRRNLEAILEDDAYEVNITVLNLQPEEPKVQTVIQKGAESEDDEAVEVEEPEEEESVEDEAEEPLVESKEYNLYEDWRILEAAEAYRAVNGPRGLGSRKIWGQMTDPETRELLLGGKRSGQALVTRYSGVLVHLSESEERMIEELGHSLSIEEMKRLRGQYANVDGRKQLLGIYEQIYDGVEGKMLKKPTVSKQKPSATDKRRLEEIKKTKESRREEEEDIENITEPKESVEKDKYWEDISNLGPSQTSYTRRRAKPSDLAERDEVAREYRRSLEEKLRRGSDKDPIVLEENEREGDKENRQRGNVMEEEGEIDVSEKIIKKRRTNGGEETIVIQDDQERRVRTPMREQNLNERTYLQRSKAKETIEKVRDRMEQVEEEEKDRREADKEIEVVNVVENKGGNQQGKLTKREKAKIREQQVADRLKRRSEEELKTLKQMWHYDAKSMIVTDAFSSKKPSRPFNVSSNVSLYVDFDGGFRQFVKEDAAISFPKNDSEKNIKWAKLSKYSKEYSMPLDKIISLFNNVCCDCQDLEQYLKTGDKDILWTDQEDKDLLANDQIALRYLVKMKGPLRIKKRREFLLRVVR